MRLVSLAMVFVGWCWSWCFGFAPSFVLVAVAVADAAAATVVVWSGGQAINTQICANISRWRSRPCSVSRISVHETDREDVNKKKQRQKTFTVVYYYSSSTVDAHQHHHHENVHYVRTRASADVVAHKLHRPSARPAACLRAHVRVNACAAQPAHMSGSISARRCRRRTRFSVSALHSSSICAYAWKKNQRINAR